MSSKSNAFSININLRPESFSEWRYSHESCSAIFARPHPILLIYDCCYIAQIIESIVTTDRIFVVDLTKRPYSFDVEPRKAMCLIRFPANLN